MLPSIDTANRCRPSTWEMAIAASGLTATFFGPTTYGDVNRGSRRYGRGGRLRSRDDEEGKQDSDRSLPGRIVPALVKPVGQSWRPALI
jgi:hypothetical protein